MECQVQLAMNKYHGGVANYRSSEGKDVKIKYTRV